MGLFSLCYRCFGAGVLAFWRAGVLACWGAGVLVCWGFLVVKRIILVVWI
jgi:hypothetical protein